MDDSKIYENAGRLIGCGLVPSKRPTQDSEYSRLIKQYFDDSNFEKIVKNFARGLGLEILDMSEYGIVLGALPESPFNLTVSHYRKSLTSEERLLHGLVQVGLAAYLYPRAEDIESDTEVKRVSVCDLDEYLREQSENLGKTIQSEDVPSEHPELERAFRIYSRWPSTKRTATGRRSTKTTQGIILKALEKLAEHGLLRRAGKDGGGTYQALRRYRVQVRELSTQKALQMLREDA